LIDRMVGSVAGCCLVIRLLNNLSLPNQATMQ